MSAGVRRGVTDIRGIPDDVRVSILRVHRCRRLPDARRIHDATTVVVTSRSRPNGRQQPARVCRLVKPGKCFVFSYIPAASRYSTWLFHSIFQCKTSTPCWPRAAAEPGLSQG
eukprot:gene19550-biopygen23498